MGQKLVRNVRVYRDKDGKGIRFNKEPLRNEYCPCGSMMKYKKCHLGNFDKLIELLREKHAKLGTEK